MSKFGSECTHHCSAALGCVIVSEIEPACGDMDAVREAIALRRWSSEGKGRELKFSPIWQGLNRD